jgi:hypothetical protein
MPRGGTDTRRPLLWALLTGLIALVCALMAYSIGSSAGGGETGASSNEGQASAPRFLPIGGIYASARADGYRAAEDRVYLRGRREGFKEGRRAAKRSLERSYRRGLRAGLTELGDPGGFHVVSIGSGPSLLSSVRLQPGKTYTLCRRATAVCERSPRR